jgi:hypothetical protein
MFTNHLNVLLEVARDPTIRVPDVAPLLGVTERRVYRVIAELFEASALSVTRRPFQRRHDTAIEGGSRDKYEVFLPPTSKGAITEFGELVSIAYQKAA